MFNPFKVLQFRKDWGAFEERHPKFTAFLGAMFKYGLSEGCVIDIKITLPDGKELESNLRVTEEDMEMLNNLGKSEDQE